jgi:hypothetical protein
MELNGEITETLIREAARAPTRQEFVAQWPSQPFGCDARVGAPWDERDDCTGSRADAAAHWRNEQLNATRCIKK